MTIAADVLRRIKSHEASVGIIGMGYVGLPLALAFVERGFRVVGFDVDETKVRKLKAGESYIRHIADGRLPAAAATGRLDATTAFGRLAETDAILICVPTPLTAQRQPDMTFVENSARQIRAALRPGHLVILESTTYPGTTDELVKTILEESGLACGRDFFLAFSPEREDPGNKEFGTTTIPKVVGGVDETSGDLAQALYDQIVVRSVRVSSARAAEAAKLTENIFRAVNIALVNELKIVYDRMGIDIWEVLDDPRESPAFELIERLLHLGAEVSYHDPHIPTAPSMRSWPHLPPMCSKPLTADVLAQQDAVLIVTDHSGVNYDLVLRTAPLVVDTRGVYRGRNGKVVKA